MEGKQKMAELNPPEGVAPAGSIEAVLGDGDLFREILLRLASPANLVRAAAVSKRWLRHASDPGFLRRFRSRHPPRLLGFIISVSGSRPRFVHLRDPGVATVIHSGRFKLGEEVRYICDCRNGLLLVTTHHPDSPHQYNLAVRSPLHPERVAGALLPHPAMACSAGNPRPCRRFILLHEDSGNGMPCAEVQVMCNDRRVWVNVHDLQDGAYLHGRTSDPIELPENMIDLMKYGLLAHKKLYMICMKGHILVLDLPSLSLFCIKLPDGGCEHETEIGLSSCAEGSGFYLIHVKGFQIHIWHHSTSCSNNSKWKLVDKICLREAFRNLTDPSWYSQGAAVHVVAVGDNAEFVFLRIQDKVFYMQTRSRAVQEVYQLDSEHSYLFGGLVHPFYDALTPAFPVMNDGHDQDR